jgi:hypothetical protein
VRVGEVRGRVSEGSMSTVARAAARIGLNAARRVELNGLKADQIGSPLKRAVGKGYKTGGAAL